VTVAEITERFPVEITVKDHSLPALEVETHLQLFNLLLATIMHDEGVPRSRDTGGGIWLLII
jgi:hypothetical protein